MNKIEVNFCLNNIAIEEIKKNYSVQRGQRMPPLNMCAKFVLFSNCYFHDGGLIEFIVQMLALNKINSAQVSKEFSFQNKYRDRKTGVVYFCKLNSLEARYVKVYSLFLETYKGFILQGVAMPPLDPPFSPQYAFSIFWGTLGEAAL